jgi:glycerol-3-phosphate acyltransferase PlsY
MLANIVLIAGGYLLGSLPFTAALARASGLHLSEEKDLHIVLWHKVSKWRASLAALVDFIKGSITVLAGFSFGLSMGVVAFAGVAAVVGQMWPAIRNLHGEKGNSTGAGVIITLALLYETYFTLLSLIFFATGAALRYYTLTSRQAKFHEATHPLALALPVGMLAGFAAAPIAAWCSREPRDITFSLFALLTVIVVRRLTAGLKADLKTGSCITKTLVNRFLFDQSIVERAGDQL